MATFVYVGVTSGGKQIKGEIQAGSKNEVISLLRKKKIKSIGVHSTYYFESLRKTSLVKSSIIGTNGLW